MPDSTNAHLCDALLQFAAPAMPALPGTSVRVRPAGEAGGAAPQQADFPRSSPARS